MDTKRYVSGKRGVQVILPLTRHEAAIGCAAVVKPFSSVIQEERIGWVYEDVVLGRSLVPLSTTKAVYLHVRKWRDLTHCQCYRAGYEHIRQSLRTQHRRLRNRAFKPRFAV